jgi:hypothetical protein
MLTKRTTIAEALERIGTIWNNGDRANIVEVASWISTHFRRGADALERLAAAWADQSVVGKKL